MPQTPAQRTRLSAVITAIVVMLLPLLNTLLSWIGLPALTEADTATVYDLGMAAYLAIGALIAWVSAWLARDKPEPNSP